MHLDTNHGLGLFKVEIVLNYQRTVFLFEKHLFLELTHELKVLPHTFFKTHEGDKTNCFHSQIYFHNFEKEYISF